jgi:hypothetical protein
VTLEELTKAEEQQRGDRVSTETRHRVVIDDRPLTLLTGTWLAISMSRRTAARAGGSYRPTTLIAKDKRF